MAALRAQLPVERWKLVTAARTKAGRNAYLDLKIDGRKARYFVETRRGIRKEHVGPLAHLARELEKQGDRLLVCGARIPRLLGEELREHGVAYLDLGGSAFLRAPGLYVLTMGRKRTRQVAGRPNLTGAEVRLLGVFLRDPDAGEIVQQELATRARIALGAVGRGREKLVRLGILDRTAKRLWRVRDRAEGLRRFADGWGTVVRHKLHPRNYRMLELKGRGDLVQRLKKTDQGLDCLLGGEAAAGLLTRILETDHATLHVTRGQVPATAKALGLVPDDQGPVTLLERYGQGDDHELRGAPALAHPLLVWAECMIVPDERVAQAAQLLHEMLLAIDG